MKREAVKRPTGAVAEGLKQALQNEVDGREFYRMAAGSARHDGVRQMFRFLMEEEERHQEEILKMIAAMAEGKPASLTRRAGSRAALKKYRSPLFTKEFVSAGKRAEGEAAALSIGMTLEKRAIAHFAALRKKVRGDVAAEKVIDDLIDWERDHLEILSRQYEQLREMYWEEARFWPF